MFMSGIVTWVLLHMTFITGRRFCAGGFGVKMPSPLRGEGGAAYAETDEGASFRRADQYRTGESEICTCPPRSLNDLMWEKTDRGSRIS